MTSPAAVLDDYQQRTETLAASTAAGVLALYAALRAGELAPATVIPAMAAVIATANAAAVTLADLFVSAQIETAAGEPSPPTGIAPRDDSDRLGRAVETILDDEPEVDETILDEPDAEETASILDDAPEVDDEPQVDEPEVDEPEPVDDPEPVDEPAAPEVDAEDVAAQIDEPGDEPDAQDANPDPAATRLERLARAEPLETGHAITVEIINQIPRVRGWTRVLDPDPCPRCIRWAEDGRVFPKDAHFKRHLNCNCQQQVVMTGGETSSETTKEEKKP